MNNPWVIHRILNFLNSVQKVRDIVNNVKDDPSDGPGRAIGPVLAKRIILHRATLPGGRYTSMDEVLAVPGFGEEKWRDLEYTFGTPAAEAFERSLFENQVLLDNWTLLHYDWAAESQEDFRNLVEDDKAFRHTVRHLAARACAETAGHDEATANDLTEPLLHQYIDSYHNSAQGAALAFALWFYQFDADNWFSFDTMLKYTDALFSYHSLPMWEMEIRFFKGFDNSAFTSLIHPPDLPVLVNFPEQTLSIWISGLAD